MDRERGVGCDEKKFNVGVIGVGFIGPAHMEAIRRQGFDALLIICEENVDFQTMNYGEKL